MVAILKMTFTKPLPYKKSELFYFTFSLTYIPNGPINIKPAVIG